MNDKLEVQWLHRTSVCHCGRIDEFLPASRKLVEVDDLDYHLRRTWYIGYGKTLLRAF